MIHKTPPKNNQSNQFRINKNLIFHTLLTCINVNCENSKQFTSSNFIAKNKIQIQIKQNNKFKFIVISNSRTI